jgi:hypothetical protein
MPSAEPGKPREAVVTLKDGQRFSGELVERTTDRVVLRISNIDTPIPIGMVERVEILPPVLERYRAMRAMVDDNDVDRLLVLVEWLRARQQWDLALAELDHILEVQPENPEARRQKVLVESQRELAQRRVPRSRDAGPAPAALPDFPLLTERDINLIKVYEVDLADPPRMVIDRETVTRLMDEHPGEPGIPRTPQEREAMYRLSPARLLDVMFRAQARNLYGNVRVLDQPRPMRLFRDNVHRSLIANYCATTHCHGGAEAGRLMLANRRPNAEGTVYTNFLILERYRLPDGTPMINYDEPAKSPLLNLALPREMASVKHPPVPGAGGRGDQWKPFFRSTDDRRFVEAVEWIKAMYRPRPEYPIEYRGPASEPVLPRPGEAPVVR